MTATTSATLEQTSGTKGRGKRRLALLLVGLLVVAAGATAVVRLRRAPRTSAAGPAPARTATATSRDLVERDSFDGTLGYAGSRLLSSAIGGTLTKIAGEGKTIRRGETLFEIDSSPVRLLYGKTPAYRTLAAGVEDAADVRQLERNLVAMGYDPYDAIDVDDEFDSATTAAIKRWQDDLGETETGAVDLGSVVFLPGARRMGSHSAEVGAQVAPGSGIGSTTSVDRQVKVDLDADRRDLVRKGERVTVQLATGAIVRGTITSIGRVAEVPDDAADQGAGGSSTPTIEVIVSLRDGAAGLGTLDQAPVTVDIETERVQDALTVPVEALVALAEGGYAVEIVDGSSSRLVSVRPGAYASGWVEIHSREVKEGMDVVVPDGV